MPVTSKFPELRPGPHGNDRLQSQAWVPAAWRGRLGTSLRECEFSPGYVASAPRVYTRGETRLASWGCGELISPSKEHHNPRSKGAQGCKFILQ